MPTLDELKAQIKEEASEHPEQFFPVSVLEDEGFHRDVCNNCGTTFWTTHIDREVCGEPDCSGGYTFIGDAPTEKTFDVVSAWNAWSDFMEDRGYTPINKYPLAARWRDDTEVVRASIYNFQPYVVSGEVEPPANPLVVPQFCFRSNDIDNVGITGRHYTGFIMDGQCAFTAPDEYDQEKYFEDMLQWLIHDEGMAIPKDEVIIHEDSWGGGGNLGASLEFFVCGLELFNQVYMTYEIDDSAENGYRDLDTKVLDMGMGHERIVWITHGSETSYEANMKDVVEQLYERTGVQPDKEIWSNFLPYAGHLNLDEVEDIEETWQEIADKIDEDVDTLKDEVLPAAALYAIADHTRCLLVSLNDGLLPSNSGERHSLRVMARRCMEFIDKYDWDLDMTELLEWHADEFGDLYPDLRDNLEDVKEIMRHEERQYEKMQQEAARLIDTLDEADMTEEKLVELYDSKGITPDMLQRHGVDVEIPSNFYQLVAERHADEDDTNDANEMNRIDVKDAHKTERLYFEDEHMQKFEAEVVAVTDNYVVLDQTAFYPTSGGQEHDTGYINGEEVVDVIDQEGVILHKLGPDADLPEEGDRAEGTIDWERRTKHRKHHTATHIINAAAKEVLGNHIWQAGSHKTEEKARLDITHYETLDKETLDRIEERANEIVEQDIAVTKSFMPRTEAEKQYGFRIYQGGAVPGKEIRIVNIEDIDVEACGGTHCESTGEVGTIRIIGSNKVQDGTIRLEYVAGDVAEEHEQMRDDIRKEISEYIDTDESLEDIAEIFSVEMQQLPRIVRRFVEEWQERKEEIDKLTAQMDEELLEEHGLKDAFNYDEQPRDPETLFDKWKQMEKDIDTIQELVEEQVRNDLLEADDDFVTERIGTEDVGMLIRTAKHVVNQQPEKAVLLIGDTAVIGAAGENNTRNMADEVGNYAETVQGGEDFAKGFQLNENAQMKKV